MTVGVDKDCLIYVVHYKTRRSFVGLFDVAANGVVNGNFASSACLRVVGANLCCGDYYVIGDGFILVVDNYNVGGVDLLRV